MPGISVHLCAQCLLPLDDQRFAVGAQSCQSWGDYFEPQGFGGFSRTSCAGLLEGMNKHYQLLGGDWNINFMTFHFIYGMSSFPTDLLHHFFFQRGRFFHHQPVKHPEIYGMNMAEHQSHRIGLWEKLQESPIFDGKNQVFL